MDSTSNNSGGPPDPSKVAIAAPVQQAAAARSALPHLAVIERTRSLWLSVLDMANDVSDLHRPIALAPDATAEIAAAMASGPITAAAQKQLP